MVLKIIAVLLISVSVGILYRIPRKLLVYVGAVGVVAWLIMYNAMRLGGTGIFAAFVASIAIGIMSEILARVLKKPATIFIIPGFIPLVPGGDAYLTMLHMVGGHYADGVAKGMQTILTAGAIAFGIFVSSTIFQLIKNYNLESRWQDVRKS